MGSTTFVLTSMGKKFIFEDEVKFSGNRNKMVGTMILEIPICLISKITQKVKNIISNNYHMVPPSTMKANM